MERVSSSKFLGTDINTTALAQSSKSSSPVHDPKRSQGGANVLEHTSLYRWVKTQNSSSGVSLGLHGHKRYFRNLVRNIVRQDSGTEVALTVRMVKDNPQTTSRDLQAHPAADVVTVQQPRTLLSSGLRAEEQVQPSRMAIPVPRLEYHCKSVGTLHISSESNGPNVPAGIF